MKYIKDLPKLTVIPFFLLIFCGMDGYAQQFLKFVVVTDTHTGKSGNDAGLEEIVADININTNVDFVLHAGDISDFGSAAELGEAKRLLDGLNKPYYIIPGNHDTGWSDSGGLAYDKLWKEQKFLTDFDGVRFIGFGTGPYGRMSRGFVPLDQLRWLDSLIKVTPRKQKVIFIAHYPLDEGLSNYEEVIDRLHKFNTLAVLCGHGHKNKVFDYEGIPGIMTRTAQQREGTLAYNIFTLTDDSLQVRMVEVNTPENKAWTTLLVPSRKKKNALNYTEEDSGIDPRFKNVKAVWTYQDEGNIVTTPAVWENSILTGNLLGEFKSLDGTNGSVHWRFKTGQSIYSSAAVSGNKVVFGSADSTIYCLNAEDGSSVWQLKTGAPVLASPVIHEDVVYIGSSDLKFRAIALATGKVIWTFNDLAGFPPSKPALADGKVVFGTWNKTLYALNTYDGSLAWQWSNDDYSRYYSPAMGVPVIQNEKVYIVSPDEKLRAFDLISGKQTSIQDKYRVRESLGGSVINDWLIAKTMQDTVVAWTTRNGGPEVIMSVSAGYGKDFSFSTPVVVGSVFYFGTTFGRVYAFDMMTKCTKWAYQLSYDMVNTVNVLSGNRVVATSADGKVTVLEDRW